MLKEQLNAPFNPQTQTHTSAYKKNRCQKERRIVCSPYFSMSLISHAQIQLMEAKRQLETQVALYQKTKELLNAADLELNTLRLQQGSSEARHSLSSPSTPIIRGWRKHTHTYRQKYVTQQHSTQRNPYMYTHKCMVFSLVVIKSHDFNLSETIPRLSSL